MTTRRRDLIYGCAWIGLVFLFSFAGSCHWHYSSDHCKHHGGKCHHKDEHAAQGAVRVFVDTERLDAGHSSVLGVETMALVPVDTSAPLETLLDAESPVSVTRDEAFASQPAVPTAFVARDVPVGEYDKLRLTIAGAKRTWVLRFDEPIAVSSSSIAEVVVVFDRRAAASIVRGRVARLPIPAVWIGEDTAPSRNVEGTLAWLDEGELVVDLPQSRGSIRIERTSDTHFESADGQPIPEDAFMAGTPVALTASSGSDATLEAAKVVRLVDGGIE